MAAESGHEPSRSYWAQDGSFHLNGAAFYDDNEDDVSAGFENLDALGSVTAGTAAASKAVVLDANKQIDAMQFAAQTVTPNNDSGADSTINAGVRAVDVAAVTNDADDWIVLPALADVPVAHEIIICCNAGTDFELRTPATSNEEINSEDCDGTKEYLCTDGEVVKVVKISDTIGWMAHAYSAIGAVVTAVVPD